MAKGDIVKVTKDQPMQYVPSEAQTLIAQAINKNVPVETMEKLLAMRRELKEEHAREMFFAALSKLQNEMPVVEKRKIVMNKDGKTIRYKYAPIDDIIRQTKKYIKNNGFSYIITSSTDNSQLNVTCRVTHLAGHTESSSFVVPIDKTAFMNSQQQFAAASTYAKRYAFCNAFGILTGDEDDDADSLNVPKTPETPVAHQQASPVASGSTGAGKTTNAPSKSPCPICHTTGKFHKPGCANAGENEVPDKTVKEPATFVPPKKMSNDVQRARILALGTASGLERNVLAQQIFEKYKIKEMKELEFGQAEEMIKSLTPAQKE